MTSPEKDACMEGSVPLNVGPHILVRMTEVRTSSMVSVSPDPQNHRVPRTRVGAIVTRKYELIADHNVVWTQRH